MTPDFYGELGVTPQASIDEIRRAFRRLAAENDPLSVTHLSEDQRQAAALRTERLLLAFKVLTSEEDRLLFDQCLAKGYDFERVHGIVAAETAAERQAQADEARAALEEVVAATARDLEQAIRELEPELQWTYGDTAQYFDAVLHGRTTLRLVRVHIKVLPSLDAAAVAGVLGFADQLLEITREGMTTVQDAYLLVASTLPEPGEVAAAAQAFNLRRWRDAPARKPRAFLAYACAAEERVVVAGVDDPVPDLRRLDV